MTATAIVNEVCADRRPGCWPSDTSDVFQSETMMLQTMILNMWSDLVCDAPNHGAGSRELKGSLEDEKEDTIGNHGHFIEDSVCAERPPWAKATLYLQSHMLLAISEALWRGIERW